MQLVEIAAAVRQRARVLVLDEPNSALSKRESERLFELVRQLRGEGVTVIYVSHHLQEVLDLADRITVVRDGRIVETLENDNIPGRSPDTRHGRSRPGQREAMVPRRGNSQGADVVLAVKNLTAPGLDDISFEVRAGEILGIGGLPDFGKDGLGEALFGLCERGGRVAIDGKDLRALRPARLDSRTECRSCRPIDGARAPAVDERSLTMSCPLPSPASPSPASSGAAPSSARRARRSRVSTPASRDSVRSSPRCPAATSRRSSSDAASSPIRACSILHEPTRGIDVGAKAEIYAISARHRWRRRGDRDDLRPTYRN